jgi:hypothetical protein
MKLGFKEYRKTNDAVMVADMGFKKQLAALDPELDVVWNGSKWEIWRFPGQGEKVRKLADPRATHVMTIQTKDRNFRELGADILLNLQAGDTTKFSTKQLCDYFDRMDDNIQRAKEKELENMFIDRMKEVSWFTRGLRVSIPKRFLPGSIMLKGPSKNVKIRRALQNA